MRQATKTDEDRKRYPLLPASARTDDPKDVIYSGDTGSPFVDDIRRIQTTTDEVRLAISREMRRWEGIHRRAIEHRDEHVSARAANELTGLHALIYRLDRI